MKKIIFYIIFKIANSLHIFNKPIKYFQILKSIFISEWRKCEIGVTHKSSFIESNVQIFGGKYISLGKNTTIKSNTSINAWYVFKNQVFNPKITIGNDCSIGEYCHITCINEVKIGNGVLMGKNVLISDNSHGDLNIKLELNLQPNLRALVSKGSILIEDNVWIGEKVSVLGGVKIGKNSIIGAHSVVNKDIPDNSLAAGIPAKVVKSLI